MLGPCPLDPLQQSKVTQVTSVPDWAGKFDDGADIGGENEGHEAWRATFDGVDFRMLLAISAALRVVKAMWQWNIRVESTNTSESLCWVTKRMGVPSR